jgi:hypothetical protein
LLESCTGQLKTVVRWLTAVHVTGVGTAFIAYQVQVGVYWNCPRHVDSQREPSMQFSEN